jgi:GNAT superfamily N-acetyltransferase
VTTNLIAPLVIERVGRDDLSLRALATLRMTVFRGWPYLYDGSLDYEAAYLDEFLGSTDSIVIVARIGDIPIGMATASPMATQSGAIRDAFLNAGFDASGIHYFGESVLLPQFRGLGIGHRFFDEREAAAKASGAEFTTFCAVVRDGDDPRRPEGARDLASFWQKRGYSVETRCETQMRWKEVGQPTESDHRMRFWIKRL